MAAAGRLISRPRVRGTMQNAQNRSQPSITVRKALRRRRPREGRVARGQVEALEGARLLGARARARRPARGVGQRRHEAQVVRAEHEVELREAAQQRVALLLRDAAADAEHAPRRARAFHARSSAEVAVEPVLGLLADRAGVDQQQVRGARPSLGRSSPAWSSRFATFSESWTFIWQP